LVFRAVFDVELLQAYVYEAVVVDEELAKARRSKR